MHAFRCASASSCLCCEMYTKYKVCLDGAHKSICAHVQECPDKCSCVCPGM